MLKHRFLAFSLVFWTSENISWVVFHGEDDGNIVDASFMPFCVFFLFFVPPSVYLVFFT